MRSKEITRMTSLSTTIFIPPMLIAADCKVPGRVRATGSAPQTFCERSMITMPIANELNAAVMCESGERNLRNPTNSTMSPKSPETIAVTKMATGNDAPSAMLARQMNPPSMKISPWAKFNLSSTPKTSVYPCAISAYMLPSTTPLMICSTSIR